VISGGLFEKDIFANKDSTLGLIDYLTGVETIIATGGSHTAIWFHQTL
jgi:hypothetical protein